MTNLFEFDYNSLTLEDLDMYQYYYFECDADNKKIIAKRKED